MVLSAGLFRVMLALGAGLAGYSGAASPQAADNYPNRPIRVIVPASPGGAGDIVARLVGDKLKDKWGQPFVVEARPGGNGLIGMNAVAQSKPDGYTLLSTTSPLVSGPLLFKSFTVDQANDFDPVIESFSVPLYVIVHPAAPFKTIQELVAYAKANPGKVNFGGSVVFQMDSLLLLNSMGIEVNFVGYPGSGSLPQALLGNSVQVIHTSLPSVRGIVADNRARALAVAAPKRSVITPDLPAIGEVYPQADVITVSNGFSIPKGTPGEIINKLNVEINSILKMPEIVERLSSTIGAEVRGGPPANWKIAQEVAFQKMKRAAQLLNIQPQ